MISFIRNNFFAVSESNHFYTEIRILEEVALFQEDNVSGMNVEKRKEFLKMFELVESKSIDVIVPDATPPLETTSDKSFFSEQPSTDHYRC